MERIKKSVGKKGVNSPQDVGIVQALINKKLSSSSQIKQLSVDKRFGTNTHNAIIYVQKYIVKMLKPDGIIDPSGRTIRVLNTENKSKVKAKPLIICRKNARPELSSYTKEILQVAMKFAKLQRIDVSSTRRLIEDQARIMYNDLEEAEQAGRSVYQIRGYNYGQAGQAVDKIFAKHYSELEEAEIKEKMADEIRVWLKKGIKTSKHVVTKEMYQITNILDVPYSSVKFEQRDEFEQALVSISETVIARKYSKNKKTLDTLGKNLIERLIIEKMLAY